MQSPTSKLKERSLLLKDRAQLFTSHFMFGKRIMFFLLIVICLLLTCVNILKTIFRQEFTPKILLERSSSSYFDGINLFQNHCMCQAGSGIQVYQLKEYLETSDVQGVIERRKKEHKHFLKRQQARNILFAPPHLPMRYPIYGIQVMPLHTIRLPGLEVNVDLDEYKVTLEATLGTINTIANMSIVRCLVFGRGEKIFSITTAYINVLNYILNHTTYTSTVYSIDTVDIVTFTMNDHRAQIPVSIRQPEMIRLYDPSKDNSISSLVTITTKTFLRYNKLRVLISSIRHYYPDIKIIIADDNDVTQKIEDANVEQYFMPYAKGWFSGRNLAVSQVTTKYFLWVDDDYLFTEETQIEKLVDVLEQTDLDLVGGSVGQNTFSFKLLLEEGGEEGDCLHWREGGYQKIEGFPNCMLTGGVVNFFLAHTDKVRSVGFDPRLKRVAHSEFFIDGLGQLKVGSCSHVSIGHQQKNAVNEVKSEEVKKYDAFRENTQEQVTSKLRLLFFKNRLRCFSKK